MDFDRVGLASQAAWNNAGKVDPGSPGLEQSQRAWNRAREPAQSQGAWNRDRNVDPSSSWS